MKALLIKLLTGKAGRIKSAIAAMLIGAIAGATSKAGFEMSQDTANLTTLLATALSGWLLEAVAAKLGIDGVKEMQGVLREANPFIRTDGDAGKITLAALQELLWEAGYPLKPTPRDPSTHTPPKADG